MKITVVITVLVLFFTVTSRAVAAPSCETLFATTHPVATFQTELYDRVSRRILDLENNQLDLLGQLRLTQHARVRGAKPPGLSEAHLSIRVRALKQAVELAKADPTLDFLNRPVEGDKFWSNVVAIEDVVEQRAQLFRYAEHQFGRRLSRTTFEKISALTQNERFLALRKDVLEKRPTTMAFMYFKLILDLPPEFVAKQLVELADTAMRGEPYEIGLLRIYDPAGLDVPTSTLAQLSLLTRVIRLHDAAQTQDDYYRYVSELTFAKP